MSWLTFYVYHATWLLQDQNDLTRNQILQAVQALDEHQHSLFASRAELQKLMDLHEASKLSIDKLPDKEEFASMRRDDDAANSRTEEAVKKLTSAVSPLEQLNEVRTTLATVAETVKDLTPSSDTTALRATIGAFSDSASQRLEKLETLVEPQAAQLTELLAAVAGARALLDQIVASGGVHAAAVGAASDSSTTQNPEQSSSSSPTLEPRSSESTTKSSKVWSSSASSMHSSSVLKLETKPSQSTEKSESSSETEEDTSETQSTSALKQPVREPDAVAAPPPVNGGALRGSSADSVVT